MSEWQKITSDKNILHFISQCDIEFKDSIVPFQHSDSLKNIKFNKTEYCIIGKEITKLLEMGYRRSNFTIRWIHIYNFCAAKKEWRLQNDFKLEKVKWVCRIASFQNGHFWNGTKYDKPNIYMASVDLRHAYYSVSVDENYRKYLRFFGSTKFINFPACQMVLHQHLAYSKKLLK